MITAQPSVAKDNQFTGDKKLIQKTGTHNVTYDSSFKERGEPFTHKKPNNLDELIKSLAEIKNTQLDKEYKAR